MSSDGLAVRRSLDLTWVESMGGPLMVVPVSALRQWGGCTEDGMIVGDSDQPDDYDRACEVNGLASVISVSGHDSVSALVLGDEPATTCYLPEVRAFVRWLAADSDAELLAAADATLNDQATPWEECRVWQTDGPAVLMDSAEAGRHLGEPLPGRPRSAGGGPGPLACRALESPLGPQAGRRIRLGRRDPAPPRYPASNGSLTWVLECPRQV